jgi:hypothetical protein
LGKVGLGGAEIFGHQTIPKTSPHLLLKNHHHITEIVAGVVVIKIKNPRVVVFGGRLRGSLFENKILKSLIS